MGRDMLVSGGRLYFEINQEYGRETVDMLAGLEGFLFAMEQKRLLRFLVIWMLILNI